MHTHHNERFELCVSILLYSYPHMCICMLAYVYVCRRDLNSHFQQLHPCACMYDLIRICMQEGSQLSVPTAASALFVGKQNLLVYMCSCMHIHLQKQLLPAKLACVHVLMHTYIHAKTISASNFCLACTCK